MAGIDPPESWCGSNRFPARSGRITIASPVLRVRESIHAFTLPSGRCNSLGRCRQRSVGATGSASEAESKRQPTVSGDGRMESHSSAAQTQPGNSFIASAVRR